MHLLDARILHCIAKLCLKIAWENFTVITTFFFNPKLKLLFLQKKDVSSPPPPPPHVWCQNYPNATECLDVQTAKKVTKILRITPNHMHIFRP